MHFWAVKTVKSIVDLLYLVVEIILHTLHAFIAWGTEEEPPFPLLQTSKIKVLSPDLTYRGTIY